MSSNDSNLSWKYDKIDVLYFLQLVHLNTTAL